MIGEGWCDMELERRSTRMAGSNAGTRVVGARSEVTISPA